MDDIFKWFEKMQNPVELIDSYAKLHHRRKQNEHSIVLVAEKNSEEAKMFYNLSIEYPEFKWFQYCGPLNTDNQLQSSQLLINNSLSEEMKIDLKGGKTKEEILKHIEIGRYPSIKKYENPVVAEMIFERNKPALMFIADTHSTYDKYATVLKALDKEFIHTAPVVIFIRDNVKQADRFLNYFGI